MLTILCLKHLKHFLISFLLITDSQSGKDAAPCPQLPPNHTHNYPQTMPTTTPNHAHNYPQPCPQLFPTMPTNNYKYNYNYNPNYNTQPCQKGYKCASFACLLCSFARFACFLYLFTSRFYQ